MSTSAPHRLRLDPADTAVLLIDFQERLYAAMPDGIRQRQAHHAEVMLRGARELDVPVLITEQYPKGLGPTIAPLRDACPSVQPLEKLSFSCAGEPSFLAALESLGRRQLIITGMETHVCVYQTVLDLLDPRDGNAPPYVVHLLADACLSRRTSSHRSGLSLCRQAGAVISNTETALFQLVGVAGTERFKAISRLVK